MQLKKYRLINSEGVGAIELRGVVYQLDQLTDEQAERLYWAKCHYVEPVPMDQRSDDTHPDQPAIGPFTVHPTGGVETPQPKRKKRVEK